MATRLKREATAPDIYCSNLGQLSNRMTTEMSNAIRRRHETSGIDYWKSGLNSFGPLSGFHVQDKRPAYNRLSHINLDFPGVFLPNLGTKSKPKKKESSPSTVLVTRNRTSSIPGFHTGSSSPKNIEGTNGIPKRAIVTDLTCMQLADTLFSTSNPSYSGVLNFGPGKLRYSDYFDDTDGEKPVSAKLREVRLKPPAIKYQTFQAEDFLPYSTFNNNRCSPVSPEREIVIQLETPREDKPQKSILKNPDKATSDTTLASSVSNGKPSNSYVLPPRQNHAPRSGCSKDNGTVLAIQTPYPKNAIRNDLGPLHGYALAKVYPDGALDSARKRSVRFNTANQIKEYKPTEPVCS